MYALKQKTLESYNMHNNIDNNNLGLTNYKMQKQSNISLLDVNYNKISTSTNFDFQYWRSNKPINNKLDKINSYNKKAEPLDVRQEISNYQSSLLQSIEEKSKYRDQINTHRLKQISSDIFFNKNTRSQSNTPVMNINMLNRNNIYQSSDSDIFHNKAMTKKSGENYLLSNLNKVYTVSNLSNSEWVPFNSRINLLNHCSQQYHILNPSIKAITKTKQDIVDISSNFNPTHRQTSIGQFNDITRIGSENPNKLFVETCKKHKQIFNRTNNLCNNFAEMANSYTNLCGKTFTVKK